MKNWLLMQETGFKHLIVLFLQIVKFFNEQKNN